MLKKYSMTRRIELTIDINITLKTAAAHTGNAVWPVIKNVATRTADGCRELLRGAGSMQHWHHTADGLETRHCRLLAKLI